MKLQRKSNYPHCMHSLLKKMEDDQPIFAILSSIVKTMGYKSTTDRQERVDEAFVQLQKGVGYCLVRI